MAYRSGSLQTATTGGSFTVTVNKPVGLVAGDMIVLAVLGGANLVSSFTWPAGFTQRGGIGANVGSIAHDSNYAVATKVATSSEPSTYTITASSTKNYIAISAAWTGRSSVTFATVSAGNLSGGATNFSIPLPGGTAASGDDIAWFGMVSANGAYSIAAPSGYTLRTSTADANGNCIGFATLDGTTSGATGTLSGTATGTAGAEGFGIVVALTAAIPLTGSLGQFDPEMRILGWF